MEKTKRLCANCENEFPDGGEFYGAIYDRVNEFERLDFCPECWPPTEDPFSYWKCRIPLPEGPVKVPVNYNLLLDFFVKLENHKDSMKQSFRYVLALMLVRKRYLKLDGFKTRHGKSFMKVTCSRKSCSYEVLEPELDEKQTACIQQQLIRLLDAGQVDTKQGLDLLDQQEPSQQGEVEQEEDKQ